MRGSVSGLRDQPGPRYFEAVLSSESWPVRASSPASALSTDLLADAMMESVPGVQPCQ